MTAYYNEWERYPAAWLRNLIGDTKIAPGDVSEKDIKDIKADELKGYSQCHFFAGIGTWSYALRLAGWEDEREVWTGSCPCQPFSIAGKRRGTDDVRHLWPEWFRLIRECRPGVIFGEQVASRDGLAWFDIVSVNLESAGYSVGAFDLCASSVGAPHIRQRLYFVAHAECRTTERYRQSLARTQGRDESESEERERLRNDIGNGSDSLILADSQDRGRQRDSGTLGSERRSPTNGFWTDAKWLSCSDGKARPTQPRVFPLAHGHPQRVARLRAIGNAIVAPLAAAFIRAYMESVIPLCP